MINSRKMYLLTYLHEIYGGVFSGCIQYITTIHRYGTLGSANRCEHKSNESTNIRRILLVYIGKRIDV